VTEGPRLASDARPEAWRRLFELIAGKWISQAIAVAAELGIADILKERPRSAADIAEIAGASEDAVFRLLRALASLGLVSSEPGRRFALTAFGSQLCRDAPASLRGWARFVGHATTWRPWGELAHSVRTGESAFANVFGMSIFDYLGGNASAAEVLNDAMTSDSSRDAAAVVQAYDFSEIRTLVDVGGGHGVLLAALLKANPEMRGILLELPHAVAGAAALLRREGIADRVALVTGDFFDSVPERGDAYLLKHVIHDWDDERAVRILRNCRRVMHAEARLLLVEYVLHPGDAPDLGKFVDLEMLVMTPGGRERTAPEFGDLCAKAGFEVTRIVRTATPKSVIEAAAVHARPRKRPVRRAS
jgi:O-methyltransferase/methyltransferase family protein